MTEHQISRRVAVTLVVATDLDPAEVQLRVMAAVSDQLPVDHTSVHGWDANDPVTGLVQLVVYPVGGLAAAYVDRPEEATEHARTIGGLVIDWAANEDYRPEIPMGGRS